MRRYLVLLVVAVALAVVRWPGTLPPPAAPPDTTTCVLGSVRLLPQNHLFVRGHELTGTVTGTYRRDTTYLNGIMWRHAGSIEDAKAQVDGLRLYMGYQGSSIAVYTTGGSMMAGDRDADRFMAEIEELKRTGWQLDSLKSGDRGLLREIAEQHGYRPRPQRSVTGLVTYAPSDTGIVRPLWRVMSPWKALRSPAIVDTIIFAMLRPDSLSVLDARTGRKLRSIRLKASPALDCSVADDGSLYVASSGNQMTAVDLRTGLPLWSGHIPEKHERGCMIPMWMVTPPALGDGRVYFGSQNGSVYAFHHTIGTKVWQHNTGSAVSAPPLFSHGIVYVASDEIQALDAGTGRVIWSLHPGERIEHCQPVLIENTVYVAGLNGTLFAMDAENGAIRWSKKILGDRFGGQIAGSAGLLFLADGTGIHAVDPSDGRAVWSIAEPAWNPVCANGLVFCVTRAGELLVIDPSTGTVRERHDVGGDCFFSSPVVSGGRVFVAASSDSAGVLTGFDFDEPGHKLN